MKDNQCPICEAKAEIKEVGGGVAYFIRCFGDCPQFEIPKGIESKIRKIHGRRPNLREGMKEFKSTHPDRIALVRPNCRQHSLYASHPQRQAQRSLLSVIRIRILWVLHLN
jgi:hypothetical protein